MRTEQRSAADEALRKIYSFNLQRFRAESELVPPLNRLYHYTTAEGLKGIVENHEIWATSAYYLNDSAEIAYGCKVATEAMASWAMRKTPAEKSFPSAMVEMLRAVFTSDLSDVGVYRPVFLACFCENDNLLSQWRFYGQSGGYSVGISVPTPQVGVPPTMMPEPVIYTAKWAKVVYDKVEQLARCQNALDGTLSTLMPPEVGKDIFSQNPEGILGVKRFLAIIADILLDEIVAFKDKAFDVENEWRIVVRPRELYKQGQDDGGKTPVPIYFRTRNGVVVPYVRILPTKGHHTHLPIVSVRTGPTLDKNNAALSVNMLMQNSGYTGVAVTGSDITVRL
jgi:hypothetical protein